MYVREENDNESMKISYLNTIILIEIEKQILLRKKNYELFCSFVKW